MFRFCMTNLDSSEASLQIVKEMLAGGANARAEMAGGGWPLYWGIGRGPEMTELLLNAGADPNSRDSGRPARRNLDPLQPSGSRNFRQTAPRKRAADADVVRRLLGLRHDP